MTKKFQKSVSLLLTAVMLVGFLPLFAGADECGYTPVMRVKELNNGDTDAVAGEAYSILNDDDIKALSEYCNSGRPTQGVIFYLKHDVTNSERRISPIGTEEYPFEGVFDGCGYVIDGLGLKSTEDTALFGYVSGEIRNLCVLGTAYGANVGGIAAHLSGRIANCMCGMSLSGKGICGGITAFAAGGKIENCIFTGKCAGGGIAGELSDGAGIDNCYYTYYGAGSAVLSTQEDCTCNVYRFASSPTMCVCETELSLGSYTGEDITELLNAWIGVHGDDGIIYRQWYFDTRSEATERIGGRYPTITYPDYAFPEEAKYSANASMTTLYELKEDAKEGAYYSISDALELSYLAEFVNAGYSTKGATFFLTADMSIISSDSHYKGDSWVPIGDSNEHSFKGVFDGQGYVITELLMNDVVSSDCPDYAGLFGYVNYSSAVIKNVGINGDTRNGKNAGGIVARMTSGTVKNCWYSGDISADRTAGGIIGEFMGGCLENCAYFGTASSDGNCGGIAGVTQKGSEIKFCYYSNENSAAVGSGDGKVYLAASFKKTNDEYILSRSVSITDTSTIRLLNALNQWVENIAMDDTLRPWKHDTSAGSVSRIRGDHPTHIYFGEGKSAQYAAETPMETERKENPYNISYHTTSTMTELYESKTDAKEGGNYSISTGDEMSLLSLFVEEGFSTKGANFYLTTDIYLTNQGTEHAGAGWVPIGTGVSFDYAITSTNRFYGNFDGCGFTVYGLYIVSDFLDFAGLFGRCKGSTIKNLGVCGEILGDDEVGGIVGRLEDGEIINCWSSVTIQASTEIGGIAGHIVDSKVINCSNYGFIVTTLDEGEDSGGIIGSSFGECEISNCYYLYNGSDSMGNAISTKTSVNDVLYFHYDISAEHSCTLQHAISVGELISDDLLTVLNAWVYAQDSDQYCTWHMATSVQEIPGATGHYPVLLNSTVVPMPADPDYCGDYEADATISELYSTRSNGEEGCYYSISNTDDLLAFRKYVNEGYKTSGITFFLTRDINLRPIYSADTGQSWTPIGTAKEPFKGVFDGQGYTVKYLYIDLAADDDQGLFGHVSGYKSVVKNLGVTGQISSLGVNIAAICADFDFGLIANCWTACEVEGSSNVGGIVGGANMGTIVNCVNYGLIIGAKEYGAITGSSVNTEIKNCYYLYASCQQAYPDAAVPNASNVTFFNGSGAMCVLHEYVDVEGTQTKNLSMALKMYVDSHMETNYCYWDIAKSEEYALMGVGEYPVLVSASGTMGETDYKNTVAVFDGEEYYSMPRAIRAANNFEGGGTVKMVLNAILEKNEKLVLDDDVSIATGDYSLIIKSGVYVKSMSQLNGTFIIKEGGSIYLWDEGKSEYRLFIHSDKGADMACNSEFYGTDSLTLCSAPVEGNASAYNLAFYSGVFFVNSTIDSGNPHKIPAGSTLTIQSGATLNVLSNARIRTVGGAEIFNYGTVIIGNATLDRNKGVRMKGVLEDSGGDVTLPYIYLDGYTLRGWSDGKATHAAGSTVTVEENTTLTAQWSIGVSDDPYPGDDYFSDNDELIYDIPITVIQTDGGKISPTSFYAAQGENKTLTVTPLRTCYVKNVLVDGKPVELDENGCFTLVSISKPHTVIALFATNTNTAYASWKSDFEDIPEDYWCYDSIRYVASAGLCIGTGDSCFSPAEAMTREMVVTVLWRMSGRPVMPEGYGESFSDVYESDYAYEAVRWASSFGIVNGLGDGSFGYGEAVTREQLVTMLFRYAKLYAGEDISLYDGTNILGYTDVLQISMGMTQAFQWAIGAGIVTGTTSNTLAPKEVASREQFAAIISRYCNGYFLQEPVF